ncbi:MAG: hypothetical protein GY790_19430 [Bacteroidetes bacterium]|nr:hypothetical protein [Bacteroidota bacterium]
MNPHFFIKIRALILLLGLLLFSCQPDSKTSPTGSEYLFALFEDLPEIKELPDPYVMNDGKRVKNKEDWLEHREYLKKLLAHYQYGEMPSRPDNVEVKVDSVREAYEGKAIIENMHFSWSRNSVSHSFRVGLLRPKRGGKFPVIIKNDLFRFSYNDILNADARARFKESRRIEDQDYPAFEEAISRGYAVCKFIRTDVASDDRNSSLSGPLFRMYPEYDWAAIAAWAWAYQLIIDYFETLDYIDMGKIAATGHSRGGKTALCAGIYEDRITLTAPNSSGSGGTATYRFFQEGQRKQLLGFPHKQQFPHWWAHRYFKFADNEDRMPFDSHFNKMLIAPRALFNTHARHDYWANPYGTQLTFEAAQSIFDLYGVPGNNGIHWRDGEHNQAHIDWLALLDFCDKIFFDSDEILEFKAPPDSIYPETRPDDFNDWELPVF